MSCLEVHHYCTLSQSLELSQKLWVQFNELIGEYMCHPLLYHDIIELYFLRNGTEISKWIKEEEESNELSLDLHQQGTDLHKTLVTGTKESKIPPSDIPYLLRDVKDLLTKSLDHAARCCELREQIKKRSDIIDKDEEIVQKLRKKEFRLRCRAERRALDPTLNVLMEHEIQCANETRELVCSLRKSDFLYLTHWYHHQRATSNRDEIGIEATESIQLFESAPKKYETHIFILAFHALQTCCSQNERILDAIRKKETEKVETLFEHTYVYTTQIALSETTRFLNHLDERVKKVELMRQEEEGKVSVEDYFPELARGVKSTGCVETFWHRKAVSVVNEMKLCFGQLQEIFLKLCRELNPVSPYQESIEGAPPALSSPVHLPVDKKNFFEAVSANKIEAVEMMVRAEPMFVSRTMQDDHLWTPLHIACHRGHIELAAMLVELGATGEGINDSEATPFHYLCSQQMPDSVPKRHQLHSLLHRLGKRNGVNCRNRSGETPLHYCILHNSDREILEFLVSHGASVKIPSKRGNTPANLARQLNQSPQVIERLTELEAVQDIDPENPPHFICNCQEPPI